MINFDALKTSSTELGQMFNQASIEKVNLRDYKIYATLLDKIVKSTGSFEKPKEIPSTLNDSFLSCMDGYLLKSAEEIDSFSFSPLIPQGKYSFSKELISIAKKTTALFTTLFTQVLTTDMESNAVKAAASEFHDTYTKYSQQWLSETRRIELDAIAPLNKAFTLLGRASTSPPLFNAFIQIAEKMAPPSEEIIIPKTIDTLLLYRLLKIPNHTTPLSKKVIQLAFQKAFKNVKDLLLECKKEGLMFDHYSSAPLNEALFDLIQLYTLSEKYQEDPLWKRLSTIPHSLLEKKDLTQNKYLNLLNLNALLEDIIKQTPCQTSVTYTKNFNKALQLFEALNSEEKIELKSCLLSEITPSSKKVKQVLQQFKICLLLGKRNLKQLEVRRLQKLVVKMLYQTPNVQL